MATEYIFILLATGLGVGFASGLLGVGGGFIVVPVVSWVVAAMGFPEIAMKVALGTSLLVVLFTTSSGVLRHRQKGAVLWKVSLTLGACGIVGALVGSTLATSIPEHVLKIGFGWLLIAAALWMGVGKGLVPVKKDKEPNIRVVFLLICGFVTGMISGLSGIGGGAVMVPVMVLAFSFPMHLAVGTSTGAIPLIALGGVIGYIVHGVGVPGLPPYSLGYINLPMWLCLAATSMPMAQLGAKAAHALPAKQLTYIFAALMLYLGLRMLGVFG